MRNSRFFLSAIGKNLKTEMSSFPSHGPRRLFREQFPNVAATGFEKAAALNQPFWLWLGKTGSAPATQLSRVAFEMKLVPPESQDDVLTVPPLCRVVIVLSCQPPTTWLTKPPRFKNRWPRPNGRTYSREATKRCGMLKSEGPYSHFVGQSAF